MQNVQTWAVKSPNRELQILVCSFFPNGASAINQTTLGGYIVSATRSAVGRVTVTLPDVGILIGAMAELRQNVASLFDIEAHVLSWLPVGRQLEVDFFDTNTGAGTGALVDVSASADSQCVIVLFFDGDVDN